MAMDNSTNHTTGCATATSPENTEYAMSKNRRTNIKTIFRDEITACLAACVI
uniref:Uncharacterized protein n=1 Tax=Arion vulgaris TaxID=1028688 RepID=A0A0B7A7J3_9EUPU